MRIGRLVATRLGGMIVVVLALAFTVFLFQKLSPVDPVRAIVGADASRAAVAAERARLGLNRPFLVQFLNYVRGLLTFNLGTSYRTQQPVRTNLFQVLPATAELTIATLFVGVIGGVILGSISAFSRRWSKVVRGIFFTFAAVPSFILAMLGLLFFSRSLGWLPSSGITSGGGGATGPTGMPVLDDLLHANVGAAWNATLHLVIPALAGGLAVAVALGRVLRGELMSGAQQEYVRTARAKGLEERAVILRHVVRNSISPVLSVLGLYIGFILAGSVVLEPLFDWPGVGNYTYQSIQSADFPAIAGFTILVGVTYVVCNMAVDIAQGLIDPRVGIQ
ncbi:MAG TPA: ABC transporter permease [Acidimicrobiales bacterium]|jgi:peptide/nickel transport system permease protein|nr:ABC transporter permease [Acidimicrobiales bacterium]